MPIDIFTGMEEPDVTINGTPLTFAEAMTLRVALGSFVMWLSAPSVKEGLGESLAAGYMRHAGSIESLMHERHR